MKTLFYFFFMLFLSAAAAAQTGGYVHEKQADGSIIQRSTETGLIEFTFREQIDGSVYIYNPEGVLIGAYTRNEEGELKFNPF